MCQKITWFSKDKTMTICTEAHYANHNVHSTTVKIYKFKLLEYDINKRFVALPVSAVVKVDL
jgi:hypothetical protein